MTKQQDRPGPVKAARLRVHPKMTLVEGLQMICADCLHQIVGNVAGVVHSSEPEYLHQMRIGLRRLRAACSLLKRIAPLPLTLAQELDWLAAQLGPARDWDVLAHDTLPRLAACAPPELALDGLRQQVLVQAAQVRRTAASALQDARFAALLQALADWAANPPSAMPQQLQEPLRRLALPLAQRRMRQLQKRSRQLLLADQAQRHALRISAKKARYASEFLRALYPAPALQRYLGALGTLQEGLGRLHDAGVAETLLASLPPDPLLATANAWVRGWLAAISHGALPAELLGLPLKPVKLKHK